MQAVDRPSLRAASTVWGAFACALGIAVVVTLLWTSRQLDGTTRDVLRDARAMAVADEITAALLVLNRTGNFLAGDRSAEARARLDRLERRVQVLLARERALVRTDAERALVARAARGFQEYVRTRRALEADDLHVREVIRGSAPALDATLATLAELRDANEHDLAATQARVESLDATITSVVCALVLAHGIAGVLLVLGIRRLVLAPLAAVCDAIRRFRGGQRGIHVARRGSAEVAQIGGALGEMIGSIERQRADQLTFVAGVAHDLRGPLGAMKMALGVVAHELPAPASSPAARSLAILERQMAHLGRMVGDLLDAARIEAGKLELRTQPFDLAALLRDAILAMTPCAPEHSVDLRAPDGPMVVRGDPQRIEQVATNLLSNAIKYSPAGSSIEVTLRMEESSATFEVTDHGIGIPREAQEQIFTPFRRHDAARAIAPGVGLGLSVARRIVEAHAGSLDVDSAAGGGSTFRVRLPRAPVVTPAGDAPRGRSGTVV